jgi:HSP20 family protein
MVVEGWRAFPGALSGWEPFRGLTDIQHEMNRMVDSVFGRPAVVSTAERMWVPLCDMYETKDDLYVTFELPGVSVSITGDVLTVKGERRSEKELQDDGVHRLERAYGRFERAVPLPVPVQADKVTATYRDGVLEIKLVKPKEIKIDLV